MAKSLRQKESKKINFPIRGEIYLVEFDPAKGREIKKTRPALIVQNNIGNRYSPLTIVAAISSKFNTPPYPTDVIIEQSQSGLPVRSAVIANQIRSVDCSRLNRRLGRLSPDAMRRVDEALKISLGLTEI